MVTVDEVRAFAITLPRATEAFVQGRIKFRVGRIVFLAFSRDGTLLGFGFPKEWREALVESEPDTFMPVALAFAVFGESLGPSQLLGGALVLSAVVAVRAPARVAVARLEQPSRGLVAEPTGYR